MALTYIIVGRHVRLCQIGLPTPFFLWLNSVVGEDPFVFFSQMVYTPPGLFFQNDQYWRVIPNLLLMDKFGVCNHPRICYSILVVLHR